jgi:X-X-X-Leu-X-X-Gly heptad repeat protein
VLAYVAWHRPAAGVDTDAYERSLERFHRSLAHVPPSGFEGSAAFRVAHVPWLEPRSGGGATGDRARAYEDWYLVDSWSALGVLEEAAVARGHISRHDAVAAKAGQLAGGVYKLSDGRAQLEQATSAVWVTPARGGHVAPTVADLLADGADAASAALWRRCLVLGPAPEYCLLAAEPPAGVARTRLPVGWTSLELEREAVFGTREGVR